MWGHKFTNHVLESSDGQFLVLSKVGSDLLLIPLDEPIRQVELQLLSMDVTSGVIHVVMLTDRHPLRLD